MNCLFIGHQMGAQEVQRVQRVLAGKRESLFVRDIGERDKLDVALQSIFPVEGVGQFIFEKLR